MFDFCIEVLDIVAELVGVEVVVLGCGVELLYVVFDLVGFVDREVTKFW